MTTIIESGYTGTTEPLSHPRICYQKHSPETVSASGSASGADPAWVDDGETWSIWEADAATATLTLDYGASAVTIDYVGIAASNIQSTGATVAVQVQTTDGGAFTTVLSASPSGSLSNSDDALLFLIDPRSVYGVRLSFSGGSAAPQVAVAQAGEALEFPRKATYNPSTPITESDRVTYRELQSIKGDVVSRTRQGSERQFDVQIDHLSETFRSASGSPSWAGFIGHTNAGDPGTFFIAPRPGDYPDQVAYARATERPRFSRAQSKASVAGSVQINCKGYRTP